MAGVGRYPAATLHAAKNRRGGDNYDALPLCARRIQGSLYPQLDLPLLLRGAQVLRPDCGDCGHHPDDFVFRFLLHLLHKVSHRSIDICVQTLTESLQGRPRQEVQPARLVCAQVGKDVFLLPVAGFGPNLILCTSISAHRGRFGGDCYE
jgi:hypothetical protein